LELLTWTSDRTLCYWNIVVVLSPQWHYTQVQTVQCMSESITVFTQNTSFCKLRFAICIYERVKLELQTGRLWKILAQGWQTTPKGHGQSRTF